MQNKLNNRKLSNLCAATLALLSTVLVGCSAHPRPALEESIKPLGCANCVEPPPGAVQYVWEEPMVDVVDVPPGVDPEGVYYRPAHQAVVEVRQGRWRYSKPAQ